MKEYVAELERTESGRFALTISAMPGLLILGDTPEEVLARARAAIQFYARDCGIRPQEPEEVVLSPQLAKV